MQPSIYPPDAQYTLWRARHQRGKQILVAYGYSEQDALTAWAETPTSRRGLSRARSHDHD